jgi:hypothetical protein
MHHYQNLTSEIKNIKRPIQLITALGIALNLGILTIGGQLINSKNRPMYSTIEACYFGMKGVVGNNPDERLIKKEILKDLEGKTFKVQGINLVKKLDSHSCDVVVKDDKGVKSYLVELEKSSRYAHGVKLFNIKGQKVVSKYQWRAML